MGAESQLPGSRLPWADADEVLDRGCQSAEGHLHFDNAQHLGRYPSTPPPKTPYNSLPN